MPRRRVYKSRPLLWGYMEGISSKVFAKFPKALTDLIAKEHGIYALYKRDHLWYVGLATNLRGRVHAHLKDRHAKKWDRFSLYLVRKAEHIKELESLILRIATPRGAGVKGRLGGAANLKKALGALMQREQKKEIIDILGKGRGGMKNTRGKSARQTKPAKRGKAPLAPYAGDGFRIRGTYKGKTYWGRVRKSGRVFFDGVSYNSPSLAGYVIKKLPTNGWYFWHYKNDKDEWVRLNELRKK